MIEVQKQAGPPPERTGTWMLRLDSCVTRFRVAALPWVRPGRQDKKME